MEVSRWNWRLAFHSPGRSHAHHRNQKSPSTGSFKLHQKARSCYSSDESAVSMPMRFFLGRSSPLSLYWAFWRQSSPTGGEQAKTKVTLTKKRGVRVKRRYPFWLIMQKGQFRLKFSFKGEDRFRSSTKVTQQSHLLLRGLQRSDSRPQISDSATCGTMLGKLEPKASVNTNNSNRAN